MDELRRTLIALIAEECDIEEVSAEGAASRILALPEIAEALDALGELRVDAMSPSRFGAALQNAKQPRSPGPKPDSRSA